MEQMAKDLYDNLIQSGGNATFLKSAKLIDVFSGKVMEDLTEKLRKGEVPESNEPKFNV